MEGLHLSDGDGLIVNVGLVAEYLCEEVLLLFIVEQEQLGLIVADLPVLVDPLEVGVLVLLEVGLLHKQPPHGLDVHNAKLDLVARANDEELQVIQ